MAPYDPYQNVHPYDQSEDQFQDQSSDSPINDTVEKIYKIVNNQQSNYAVTEPVTEEVMDYLESGSTMTEKDNIYDIITEAITHVPDNYNSGGEIETTVIPEIIHTDDPSFTTLSLDTTTVTQYIFTKAKHHDDSESMPYIILVIVLAVLVLLAAIAMFIYYRKKRSDSKDLAGIATIGKSFESENISDIKPHEVMYEEERQQSKRGVKFDDSKGKKTTK